MQEEIRQISIKEILIKLLYRYKIIIVMGFIGMGLMLLLSMYQAKSASDSVELEDDKKLEVEQLLLTYDKLFYYEQYSRNSLYLKVDSYNQKYLVTQYYIDSEYKYNYNEPTEPDYTSTLAELYSAYFKSSEFIDKIREAYGKEVEKMYLSELVSVGVQNNVIKISVLMNDSFDEEKLAEVIDLAIKTQEEKLQVIGAHSITLNDKIVNVVKSDAIISANLKVVENINACKKVITNALALYTNEQKKYLVDMLKYEEYKMEIIVVDNAASDSLMSSVSAKKIVIGFFGGMVGMAILYCIMFILSDKLQYASDMEVTYGIGIFGVISKAKDKEVDVTSVISNVELYCTKYDISKLTLMLGFTEDEQSVSKIAESLRRKGIETKVSSYVGDNSEALKMASDSGNVLFIEMIEKSKYSMIKKQRRQMDLYDVNIIGSVVLTKY